MCLSNHVGICIITDGRLVDAPGSVMILIRLVVAVFAAHASHFPASLRLKWYCLLEKDHLEKIKKTRKLCSLCYSIGNILVASFFVVFLT